MRATGEWANIGWKMLPDAPEGFRILDPSEMIPEGRGNTYILWWGCRNGNKTFEDSHWDHGSRDGSLGGQDAEEFCGFVAVPVPAPEAPANPKSPRKAPKLQETSLQAHRSQKDKAPTDCMVVYNRLRKYPRGTTCDRLEQVLGMSHQTTSARLNDLARRGKIVDSGRREKTRTGRPAICWKVVV